MRIRKRFPPPASNNLSAPHLHNHNSLLVVQVQHQQQEQVQYCPLAQQPKINSQPSDPPNHAQENMDGFGEIKSNNETKEEGIQCGEESSEVRMSSISPHQVFGGWFGEDRAIPIKKRRGSLGKRASEGSVRKDDDKEEKTIAKMKSKTNKKCLQDGDDDELHKEAGLLHFFSKGVNIDLNSSIVSGDDDGVKNNVKRGSVIMEGSRCSRVNGRGWRCCQQTLVGYSLCEHHLGKGRLRNMNNTRNRAKSKKGSRSSSNTEIIDGAKTPRVQQEKKKEIVSVDVHDDEEDSDDEEDDGVIKKKKKKKKKKIGMVKARSISSLLGLGQGEDETIVDESK